MNVSGFFCRVKLIFSKSIIIVLFPILLKLFYLRQYVLLNKLGLEKLYLPIENLLKLYN